MLYNEELLSIYTSEYDNISLDSKNSHITEKKSRFRFKQK